MSATATTSSHWARDVVVISAIVAVGALPLSMTGAMAVQIQDALGFGEQRLGAAYAIYFGVAALASTGLGRMTETIGAGWALRAGTVLAALVFTMIALTANSWNTLVALLAVGGVATALSRPAANLWLVTVIPSRRQGLAFGIQNTSIPMTTIVAGLAVPVFALTVGWRWAFVAGAGLAASTLLLAPSASIRPPEREVSLSRTGDLSHGLLIMLGLGMACGTIGASSLNAFTVVSLVDAGIGEAMAGVLFAVASVAGIASRVFVGHRADQREAGHLQYVSMMLLVGSASLVLFSVRNPLVAAIATPVAFATAWGWIGLFNLAIVRMNRSAPAAATGITQAGAFVGGVAGPFGLGTVAEHHSFGVAWLTAAGFAVAGALVLLAVRTRVRGRGLVGAAPLSS